MYTKKMLCNAFFTAALQDNLRSYRVNSSRMTPYLSDYYLDKTNKDNHGPHSAHIQRFN